MNAEDKRFLAIKALKQMKGDDLASTEARFGGYTDAQLDSEYGARRRELTHRSYSEVNQEMPAEIKAGYIQLSDRIGSIEPSTG